MPTVLGAAFVEWPGDHMADPGRDLLVAAGAAVRLGRARPRHRSDGPLPVGSLFGSLVAARRCAVRGPAVRGVPAVLAGAHAEQGTAIPALPGPPGLNSCDRVITRKCHTWASVILIPRRERRVLCAFALTC